MVVKPGSVVEFRDKRGILLAVCKRLEGKSLRILTELGKEFSYPADKVSHETEHVLDLSQSDPELREDLHRLRSTVDTLVGEVSVADLWEFLEKQDIPLDWRDLAQTYFGDECSTDQRSAMLRALHQDAIYFKRKGEHFLVKSDEAVRETLRQLEEQARRDRERNDAIAWLRAARAGPHPPRPEGLDRLLSVLKDVAINGEEARRFHEGAELLRAIGEEAPGGAFALLVDLGIFHQDENLVLLRERVPTDFSDEVLHEAARLASSLPAILKAPVSPASGQPDSRPQALPPRRRDLRDIPMFAIDDADTVEIDDALSLEVTDGGFRVGVHIADVAALVPADSAVDREAQRRSTTLYLPEKTISMLPPVLAHDTASLVPGKDRLAVSLLAQVDPSGKVQSFEFFESLIQVDESLTYEEADRRCAGTEGPLPLLHDLAQAMRKGRIEQGACIFERTELKISVDAERNISFKKREGEGPADIIVAELMILANRLAAQLFSNTGVPSVFRVQEAPDDATTKKTSGEVSRHMLSGVRKAQVKLHPGPHWGLGLPAYVQMTSPIRRYLDLLAHRQLKVAFGAQQDGYSEEELTRLAGASEAATGSAQAAQKWAHRYWLLVHLESTRGLPLPAVVVGQRQDGPIVRLEDYLLDVPMPQRPGARPQLGEHLMVLPTRISPRAGILRLEEANPRRKGGRQSAS